jgi:hypothetical protein
MVRWLTSDTQACTSTLCGAVHGSAPDAERISDIPVAVRTMENDDNG